MMMEEEIEVMHLKPRNAKNCLKPPEVRKKLGKYHFFRVFSENMAFPTP